VKENNMGKRLTEEEAWALDEKITNTTPRLGTGGGPLSRLREHSLLQSLDEVSANYILTIARHDNKTPEQVIGEWVREKLTVTG
jgi:hypothetical protein